MKFVIFNEDQKGLYNHFVLTHSGSFLQGWEWGEWQKSLDMRGVFRFGVMDDSGVLIMAAQAVQMALVKNRYFFYIPYGPVFFHNTNAIIGCLQFLGDQIQKSFPQAVFVRFEPTELVDGFEKIAKKTLNIQPGNTLQLDITQPMEELLKQMHPKTRYNIKIAQKHGVEIKQEFHVSVGHGFYGKEALELIVDTANRQRYYTHRLSYYEKLFNFFSLHNPGSVIETTIYKALYNNRLIASAVMVDFGKTRTYLFGGSAVEHRNVMAPYLLHFQAIKDAQEKNFCIYDFDGLEISVGKKASFARFKEGFGGNKVSFAGAYDIVFLPVWYTIYIRLRTVNRAFKKVETKIKTWL